MREKDTNDLEKVLGKTHPDGFRSFLETNGDSMILDAAGFCAYVKSILKKNGITQLNAFLRADIPERYGYKLLTGERHTQQRDVILRLCYACEMTLEETQRALRKYGMPELYAKFPRDALLMIAFGDRPGGIIELNTLLKKNGMEPLRTSGIQQ